MQCTSTWFSLYRSVLFTVRETRAPMGTKATPTVSLSTIMSVGIHNVDARLPWCQLLHFKQPGRPFIFNWHLSQKKEKDTRATSWLYHVWSLWIGASGPLHHLEEAAHQTWWTDEHLSVMSIFFVLEGRGPKGKPEGERRCDGLAETLWWWSWHPWKAQRSESLHVELPRQMRKLDISVCVRVATLGFFFVIPQGLTLVFSVKMTLCCVSDSDWMSPWAPAMWLDALWDLVDLW